ncbi:MAG: glycine--tRNA ligase subunit beta [Acidobacteriaceae bacterium]|nr:glycine--tRNA ligase subunit beta [Acidobacteriaceae bacterium]
MPDFLLEIGTEEIPDWMIEPALKQQLKNRFQSSLGSFGGSALFSDATPRRLVLIARDLNAQAPDVENVVLGPYLSAGSKGAEGFARKWKVSLDQLVKTQDTKGERYVFHQLTRGQTLSEALAEKLPAIITGIPFEKTMSWPGSEGVRFARPIRWIVALLDDETVYFNVAGISSGNTTRGHRVLGSKQPIPVTIGTYEQVLRENGVILEVKKRKQRILSGLGRDVYKDENLLETLVYLTEFPSVIRGSFDPAFLELPEEILSTVMLRHQRYFSVVKADGSIAPEFVAVINTDGDPDGLIRQGNERVLRARFNDARFFWQADQKKRLYERLPDLANVTFQAKLGSYEDKTKRVIELAARLADQAGADLNVVQRAALLAVVQRAALLAKCDLTTDMVKEFTELQGIVGGLYARAQGEGEAVAKAIYQQYRPANIEEGVPDTPEAQIVSIADKLDTLRECFKIGLVPTGSKDPFALRRAAYGVVRILFEAKLPIPLMDFAEDIPELPGFLRERIQFYLREVSGYAYDEVNAAIAAGITTLSDLQDRVAAIHSIRPTEDFEPVAASFKRIKNILKQAGVEESPEPNPQWIVLGPEVALYGAFLQVRETAKASASYRDKLAAIASLRPYVDLFFDKILVNEQIPIVRENRLALLHSLLTEFSNIADFSEIVTQGGSEINA